ncbi:MAG: hypothetical protein KBA60_04805 [Flavobacteriales bacterium]|nr:hypothetical protein [Flavobacteriales bacterium]
MERREQYDPEDIEGLLSERSFDDLLAEEKAFVLRHISDREEYERMRTMLHYMRPDESSRATIEAESTVRANVLKAFRAQKQPQWRIWLNSVAVWLIPRDGFAMWRPALALASLALLIVAGVFSVRQFEEANSTDGLTELHEVPVKPAVPKASVSANEGGSITSELERSADTSNAEQQDAPTRGDELERNEAAKTPVEARETEFRNKFAEISESAANTSPAEDEKVRPADALADDRSVSKEGKADLGKTANKDQSSALDAEVPRPSHEVTQEEFLMNQSVANATGATRSSSVKKTRSLNEAEVTAGLQSQSMAQDPAVLGLIAQGW